MKKREANLQKGEATVSWFDKVAYGRLFSDEIPCISVRNFFSFGGVFRGYILLGFFAIGIILPNLHPRHASAFFSLHCLSVSPSKYRSPLLSRTLNLDRHPKPVTRRYKPHRRSSVPTHQRLASLTRDSGLHVIADPFPSTDPVPCCDQCQRCGDLNLTGIYGISVIYITINQICSLSLL